jgi:hypothetical protein
MYVYMYVCVYNYTQYIYDYSCMYIYNAYNYTILK